MDSVQKTKKTFKDIFKVAMSNVTMLFAGVLVGFVLPKIIGVEDYGFYKTFTLYASYVGIMTLGFIDGIYLEYGGKKYETLNKERFRMYSKVYFLIEFVIFVVLFLMSLLFFDGDIQFIVFFLSLYLLFTNIMGYYQIVSQITFRFDELSLRNVIQSFLTAIYIIILWVIYKYNVFSFSYKLYVVGYVFIIGILTMWYILTFRDITFGRKLEAKNNINGIKRLFKTGMPLMFSNLCSSLILSIDRQFVNVFFDISSYAIYAFAYNMMSLVTTITSAISTVLYPKMRQYSEKLLKEKYSELIAIIMMIMFGSMLLYYPLLIFVDWFLPKYHESLPVFRVIFPGLAITSSITIIIHNYYKILDDVMNYFVKTIVILSLSIVANIVAYVFWGNTISISVASMIMMIVWYLYTESYLVKRYYIKRGFNIIYMLLMLLAFYMVTELNILWLGVVLYLVLFVVFTTIFYRKIIKQYMKEYILEKYRK